MSVSVRQRGALAAAAVVALASALAGCSGSATGPSGKGASAENLAAVDKVIDQYKQEPTFKAPGPAFDASKARGKTIFYIPLNSSLPFDTLMANGAKQAAEEAGAKFILYSNQGRPSEWVQGMDSAISRKVDLIALAGSPDPKLLGPQIKAAKAAGIAVINTHLYDVSYVDQALQEQPDLAGIVPANHYMGGSLMADMAIKETKGKVKALFITANEVQPSRGIVAAFQAELKKYCPDSCKATVVNIPIPSWAEKVPTAVQTGLLKDPNINFVVPVYDGMTPLVAAGITQAGKASSVKVVAYNGTASVLQMIQKKNLVVGEIGEPIEWLGWSIVDQALRILSGAEPITNGNTPLRVFDKDNIDETGSPATQTEGYGDPAEFKNGYRALWGLE
jgi:ribose transport system substrate-binding protein